MNREQLLARRDELARENHLGELELYRTPMTTKGRAISAAGLGGFSFLVGLLFSMRTPEDLLGFAIFALVVGCFFYLFILFFNPTYVYVYTNGLVCLRPDTLGPDGSQVVQWGKIREVWISRGYRSSPVLYAKLNDGTKIRFPVSQSRGSARKEALKKFIEEKIQHGENGPYGAPPHGQPQNPYQ